MALAAQLLRNMPLISVEDRANTQTCNMTEDEITERDRPMSRQERRQKERLAKKASNTKIL